VQRDRSVVYECQLAFSVSYDHRLGELRKDSFSFAGYLFGALACSLKRTGSFEAV
jgi:hypothetical protein